MNIKHHINELDLPLQKMLIAYGKVPERDPKFASRTRDRFMAELDRMFIKETQFRLPVTPAWVSILHHLKKNFAMSLAVRAMIFVFTAMITLVVFLFGGVGITAYAAKSSLPGDALYPLKTIIENARAKMTDDSEAQARLYLDFAGRRLLEIQTLIGKDRYPDIAQAASEFERDIQKALSAVESLSQTDPARAIALNAEIVTVLQSYNVILTQMLAGVPGDVQPVIQNAIDVSQSVAGNSDDAGGPMPTPTITATPDSLSPTQAQDDSTPSPASGGGGNSGDDGGGRDDDGADNGSSGGSGGDGNSGGDDDGGDDDGNG